MISIAEIEELFGSAVTVLPDGTHSQQEERLKAIGRTVEGRHGFMVFTIRQTGGERLIRPISARYMHRKEVQAYEEEDPGLPE